MFTLNQVLAAGLLHPFSSSQLQDEGEITLFCQRQNGGSERLDYLFSELFFLFIWKASWRQRAFRYNACSPPQHLALHAALHVVGTQKVCDERRISFLKSELHAQGQGAEAPEGAHESAHPPVPRAPARFRTGCGPSVPSS